MDFIAHTHCVEGSSDNGTRVQYRSVCSSTLSGHSVCAQRLQFERGPRQER